jgi:hypothetical protein
MAAAMRRLAVSILLAATACATDEGDVATPELGSGGKADAADHVDMRAALVIGSNVDSQFVEDLEFHGYPLAVRPGARMRIELTHAGSSSNLDATMFVYGPHTDAGWGESAIAFDDDSGWGRLPRLRNLLLDGGEYLVVIGTHDAQGRGRYRLRATCENGECAPEPMGCAFGSFLVEILEGERIEVVSRTVLTSAEGLDALTAAQIVDAVHESVHTDVTDVAEAFERVDGGEINHYELRDRNTGVSYTFFEYGSGDNSFGRVYAEGTTTVVVRDHDTDLLDCIVPA